MSYPVIQPVLPYVSTIKGGIKPDMAVIVQGTLPAHAQSFEINFKTGPGDNDDVAYHFNPRIGKYVYMNSYVRKGWEEEECVSDKPFIKGAAFQILIIIKTEGYEVYINGIKHCMFNHRIPLNKVSTFAISGDVSIPIFGFIDNWNTLNLSQSNTKVMGSLISRPLSLPAAVTNPLIQPGLSYMSKIKCGLRTGMAVFFQGTIPTNCKGFEINFKTGESDSDDIAFHFNPRIGQYVYLNSFRDGSWEKEECVSDKSFNKGAGFYMFFVINSDNYEVYVNGLRLCTFKHRIPVEKVSTLGIRGDAFKPIYGFIDNWSSLYLCMDQSRITGMGTTFSSLLADPSDLSHLVIQPTLPYFAKIPGGLRTDMALYFQGVVSAHAVM
ncbi:galectin-6-like [Silurus meridionalis]|uniref:galectin-6-like n=1 Tax=Silurus meridionalis TaxID=175797 RepID=UPI001EEA4D10|nr:galectin-6-like [Silurus meridionalis]